MTEEKARREEEIWPRLRALWERADPMPVELADVMVAAVASEDTDLDYELLELIERSDAMVGARAAAEDTGDTGPTTTRIEFSNGRVTLLLRVVSVGAGRRRIDGWVVPAGREGAPIRVTSWPEGGPETQSAVEQGRFVFPDLAPGLIRVWMDTDPVGGASMPVKPFATPLFEI